MAISLEIGYFTKRNGASIAYGLTGDGPPLVFVPPWVNSIENFVQEENATAEHLARTCRFITFDRQGSGLSDRILRMQDGFGRHADEVVELLDHLDVEKATLFGASQAGPVVLDFAARYPERTERLLVVASYANGPNIFHRPDVQESMLALIRSHWGIGSKVLTDMFVPNAPPEVAERMARNQRRSAEPESAALLLEEMYKADVSQILADITAPTLIIHTRGDRAIPFRGGQQIAAGIRGARFLPLEGNTHGVRPEDAEQYARAIREIDSFLGVQAPGEQDARGSLQTILFTDLEGSTAMQTRLGDEAAREVLRAHDGAVRESVQAHQGRVIKHTGDGIMATFSSAAQAVRAALDIRGRIDGYNTGQPNEPLLVRFGLNAGEPIDEDGDLFGIAVTLAARLGNAGAPGQVVCSNVVRELLAGKGFSFETLSEAKLKGIEGPVSLYAVR
jgi:class 3 adenylate cyclase/pimeloyl-ACP methyl ester carboxylesterase